MRLSQLIKSVTVREVGAHDDPEITGLYYDSRKVQPGGLFFALKGVASDGFAFIEAAKNAGAAAVVIEDERTPLDIAWVRVADGRLAMSRMAAAFYGDPSSRVPLVGITGTNGKTTTTYLLESIMGAAGMPAAVLGTVNYRFGEISIPAPNTTPESVDLQQTLRTMVDAGAKGIVMEVSSHALQQRRVDGCSFDVGVFSNLTRDHLDYHLDMESYLESKTRLFSELLVPDGQKTRRHAVINTDDDYGQRIAQRAACPVLTYGVAGKADISAENVVFSVTGISCTLKTPNGSIDVQSRLVGRFNLYNIMAAAGAAVALGLPLAVIRNGLERHGQVPGRLERVENDLGVTVLVDYAHTGDALENVLRTMIELKQGRIITVFGCGGDRDKGKRPIMGEIAGRYSDLSIITSDNPRTEDPAAIIAQVREGIVGLGIREYTAQNALLFDEKGFVALEQRQDAIILAIAASRPGDIILLAGKGHEDYQIIGKEKFHFDDREVAAQACRERTAKDR
ncbi:UDP-N-acetylmuramoyl-L-alanyl-D-glutamate--2,6-diaminopimelate ligase [Geotalea sp. SG265]|uniref:UDP-N-acetylmuramoyl-L-alanyl-D-glutamate--2, 6-diaminopimelate ligase n=1 Tax=Geotalea sp. SG265 TaxID=2922867 RepID=UPI001FAF967B|nr:UDP-N-acetylmuramoyl-L-alanyl-D-glutamate--2,6-diaminopimelate ligase [Geotalea sp. SG265]